MGTGNSVLEPHTSQGTAKWLWLIIFLLGWPAIIQASTVLAVAAAVLGMPHQVEIFATALLLTAVAWFGARFVLDRGAPSTIWVAMLLGSLPYAGIALLALFTVGAVVDFLGILSAAIAPPAAAALAVRRYAVVPSDSASLAPTDIQDGPSSAQETEHAHQPDATEVDVD